MRQPQSKIKPLADVIAWRREVRAAGRMLAVTNGCFDLLHRGHVEYLNRARAEADCLLVLANSDSSIRLVKGPGRPVIRERDRAYMLASLECVDVVSMFNTRHCTDLLAEIRPDVYVKGGDYTEETLVQEEYRLLKEMGCRIALLGLVDGVSTTDLIHKIRKLDQ